jgi:predicted dehydrogenase
MANISIIGGGRWARTIAGVLAGLDDGSHEVRLHARHSASDVAQWIAQRGFGARVTVSQDGPDYAAGKPDAIIVANRAVNHVAAAMRALDAGVPVLVEKPMAIGADDVRSLQECAAASGAMLAASHVFLFTRYLENFAAAVAGLGHAHCLEMIWEDGQGDVVRGDVKSYDPAVPVFDDVLPHVLPVLARIAGQDLSPASLEIAHGGAQVTIDADAGGLRVTIRLARNAKARSRILIAHTKSGPCTLDFSVEPGVIAAPGAINRGADPQWNSAGRPLRTMLAAFLAGVRDKTMDERLSPQKALASALFADEMRGRYRLQLQAWLESRDEAAPDAALDYARQEISAQS